MKNKIVQLFPKEDIPEEVYDWFVRMEEGGFTPEDSAEFEMWARKNPELAAYLPEIEKLWQHIGCAELDIPVNVKSINGAQPVQSHKALNELKWKKHLPIFDMPSYFISAVASIFLLLTIAVLFIWNIDDTLPTYETAQQQRDFLTLSDGTAIQLNALTEIKVDYRRAKRIVHLIRGEAYFKVAKDASRPFLVKSGEAEVKAIGTMFNVKRVEQQHSAITLVEGVVEVARVNNGQMIGTATILAEKGRQAVLFSSMQHQQYYFSDEPLMATAKIHLSDVNVDEVTAWKDDKIIFSGEHLTTAISTLNKHSSHQLILLDKEIGTEAIFGVFIMGDWKSAVRAIESTYPLKAETISPNKTHLVAVE